MLKWATFSTETTAPTPKKQNKPKSTLNSGLLALDYFTKQTQFSALSIKKQGLPKKTNPNQTHFSINLNLWNLTSASSVESWFRFMQNKANLNKCLITGGTFKRQLVGVFCQNEANFPHFQSNNSDCPKNEPKSNPKSAPQSINIMFFYACCFNPRFVTFFKRVSYTSFLICENLCLRYLWNFMPEVRWFHLLVAAIVKSVVPEGFFIEKIRFCATMTLIEEYTRVNSAKSGYQYL
jgi:hypothetical protein